MRKTILILVLACGLGVLAMISPQPAPAAHDGVPVAYHCLHNGEVYATVYGEASCPPYDHEDEIHPKDEKCIVSFEPVPGF